MSTIEKTLRLNAQAAKFDKIVRLAELNKSILGLQDVMIKSLKQTNAQGLSLMAQTIAPVVQNHSRLFSGNLLLLELMESRRKPLIPGMGSLTQSLGLHISNLTKTMAEIPKYSNLVESLTDSLKHVARYYKPLKYTQLRESFDALSEIRQEIFCDDIDFDAVGETAALNISDVELSELEGKLASVFNGTTNVVESLFKIFSDLKVKHPRVAQFLWFLVYTIMGLHVIEACSDIRQALTTRDVYLRCEPSSSSTVIIKIPVNQVVIIFDHKPYWYEVQYDETGADEAYTGWAPKCFVKERPNNYVLPNVDAKIQDKIVMLEKIEAKLDQIDDEDLSDFPTQGHMRVSYDDW